MRIKIISSYGDVSLQMHAYTAAVELQLLTLSESILASLSNNKHLNRGNLSIFPTSSPRQKKK